MNRKGSMPLVFAFSFLLVLCGCRATLPPEFPPPSPASVEQDDVKVALFPWVPDQAKFQQAIEGAWKQQYPGVSIVWIKDDKWDGGYSGYVPPDADVFVFDATVLADMLAAGYVQTITSGDIPNFNDFYSFVMPSLEVTPQRYAGIPHLLCTNLLYYSDDDVELRKANTLTLVRNAIGWHPEFAPPLPPRYGLYVDLSGSTTDAILYLQVQTQAEGPYTRTPRLPASEQDFNQGAITNLQLLTAMGGVKQVTDSSIDRPTLYGAGNSGRALVGYAENSSRFPPQNVPHFLFHTMPYVDDVQYNFFYVDVAAVNNKIAPSRKPLAVAMAQTITSSKVLINSSLPSSSSQNPQYLLLPRPTAMQTLGGMYDRYRAYDSVIADSNPVVFLGGPGFLNWNKKFKSSIRGWITVPPIGAQEPMLRKAG